MSPIPIPYNISLNLKVICSLIWFVGSSILFDSLLKAQDIHFSQYYSSPSNLNPALSGVFKEDLRFTGNFRNQWHAVPVDYLTLSASFDMKVLGHLIENGHFGVALLVNSDQAGDASLGGNQFLGNLSYIHRLGESWFLSTGIQTGIINRGFEEEALTFNNNWNGDIFQGDLDSKENFKMTAINFMDLSSGLNLHYQKDDFRTKVDVGVALFHLIQPNVSYNDFAAVNLARKISPYINMNFKIHDRFDLIGSGLFSKQGSNTEMLAGIFVKYYLNPKSGLETAFIIGNSFRLNDALIPTIGLHYKTWKLGFSYDVNISDFKIASNRKGGPELSLQYVISKVKPLPTLKSCPIF